MLLTLAQWLQTLSPDFGFFRVFQYITFRAVMAALTALLIGLVAGPWVIRRLVALKIGQPIRDYAMQTHLSKSGTLNRALVRLVKPFCMDRDVGDVWLWCDWLGR
jgi:phospho-N-acetylmuramoyl-pentapeptide-transferase